MKRGEIRRFTECREMAARRLLSGPSTRRHALSILLFFLAGLTLTAQQQPTFSTDVKVVNLLVTVRNKQGQIVRNLTKDDFVLVEDGHPQTIRYFAQESDLPLTLGLLVDTSLSQRRVLEEERRASYSFLDQVLRDKDLAFVLHFEGEVELLQDLTSSRQMLESALDMLQTPQLPQRGGGNAPGSYPGSSTSPFPGSGPGSGPGSRRRGGGLGRGGGTALYDAVFLASDELMKKQTGRKAVIILSDGVDNASKVSLPRAIESAQRADTIAYSILFSDEQAYGPQGGFGGPGLGGIGGMGRRRGGGYPRFPAQNRPDGKKILERISKESGGRLFEVSKKQSLQQIYASIQEELRNQYNLGYTPDQANTTPGYHKINLTTKQKDLIVQTRDGYYAE